MYLEQGGYSSFRVFCILFAISWASLTFSKGTLDGGAAHGQ